MYNKDQRLFPFIGGLVLGGVTGAYAEGSKMMPYYPPYVKNQYYNNYPYPYYYNYQNQYPYYNNMNYPYNTPVVNSGSYPNNYIQNQAIIMDEEGSDISLSDVRGYYSISDVPKYKEY